MKRDFFLIKKFNVGKTWNQTSNVVQFNDCPCHYIHIVCKGVPFVHTIQLLKIWKIKNGVIEPFYLKF